MAALARHRRDERKVNRFLRRAEAEEDREDHDVSKELFLGIMMLMLCLGIMILNVAQPVWRVHQHNPQKGDLVIVYRAGEWGVSRDGHRIAEPLTEHSFADAVWGMVREPDSNLHLFDRGGSRALLVRHAVFADSLLSTNQANEKVRTAVYTHLW